MQFGNLIGADGANSTVRKLTTGKKPRISFALEATIPLIGKDIIFAPVDDNHFRTTVTVAVSTHFLGWIVSLGGGIKIVGPDDVVEQMKDMIKQLNGQYDIL